MNLLIVALVILAVLWAVRLFANAAVRRRSARLVDSSVEAQGYGGRAGGVAEGRLARWLALAGYRDPSASSYFVAFTLCAAALGLVGVLVMRKLRIVDNMAAAVTGLLGGVGEALGMVAQAGPYIVFVLLASAPTLVVRAARRNRVEQVEQDLAPTLELLATLAEAGLGLDAAIARLQESEDETRALNQEFQIYQRDTLGGIPRLEALRRLGRRIELTSVSIFISALVQAEQIGANLSETLRTQSDDLRDRRKLRALLLAQSLPVKLVFPLMVCFLPGIFFSTLGPVISQFVDVVDSVIRRR